MANLIAIGYPDEATAAEAAAEADRLARDLMIEPDAIATMTRDVQGRYHASWGRSWGPLFGMPFAGTEFAQEIRELVQPGTSALFLVVDNATPDKAVEALAPYGGTVLKS